MNYVEKIKNLGLVLPDCPKPAGSYRPVSISGRTAYLSGQIARESGGKVITGKLGSELTLADGQKAARTAAINVLSVIHHLIGFDKVEKFLRVVGYVQTSPQFYDISQVINGASDLFVEVFGEKGVHARSSVGMASLPMNSAVELEVTLELR